MTRWMLAGCMALSALSAVAVFDVGSPTAEAAPSVSRFAGSYVGADPRGYFYSWHVTISDGGRITTSSPSGWSISGRVSDDGSYSFTVSATLPPLDPWHEQHGPALIHVNYKSYGNMVSDAAGNIVVTRDTNGGSFVWTRQ